MVALASMKIALVGAFLFVISDGASVINSAEGHKMQDIKGKWFGTLDQFSHDINDSVAVRLTVEGISGDEFTGTMEWPTFNDCKTIVQGFLDGERIVWSETAYLKGDDVVLYGLYVAQFKADNEISGDWMDPQHTINPRGPRYGTPGASFTLKKE